MPKWLDNAVFYEIYPQSFLDTNADGIGDFRGIIRKLDYIRDLGFNALWINPCFASPFGDAGYQTIFCSGLAADGNGQINALSICNPDGALMGDTVYIAAIEFIK